MMDIMEVDDFKIPVADLTSEEEQKMDDDLDYALAYCLQTDFEEDCPIPDNLSMRQSFSGFKDVPVFDSISSKGVWNGEEKFKARKIQDADYMLALQLQTDLAEGNGINYSLDDFSSSKPKSLNQNGKSIKATKEQDADYMLALQLQSEFSEQNGMNSSVHAISDGKPKLLNQNAHLMKQKGRKIPSSIVDPEWEVLDPIPDIHSLFLQYNGEFFWGRLEGVEVRWSPRMTLCAGVCCYEGRGGLCSVRLSQPLLKYRPRRDLVETLLHEMIHAYLFVTHNNKDHDAHGPEFLKHMNRINQQTGTRISVYHSFHDEVDMHRKHWWKCNGPCKRRSPFFGLVKRAMNRAPSPRDPWWARHQATCGGTFIKVKEPERSTQKNNLKRKSEETDPKPSHGDIRNFFNGNSPANKENRSHSDTESSIRQPGVSNIHMISSPVKKTDQIGRDTSSIVPFSGKGYILGSEVSGSKTVNTLFSRGPNFSSNLVHNKVTKLPPVGNGFPSRGNEIKNFRSPVQKKPPLYSESKTKPPGSVKTSATSGRGDASEMAFKGKGKILGGGPGTSVEKKSKFPRSPKPPSASLAKEEISSRDSLDDSFDDIFPKASNSRSNTKSDKVDLPFLKKEVGSSQSKINLQAVSPDRKNFDNIKLENGSANNSGSSPLEVKCPVCGSVVRDFAINTHLDSCLKKFS